MLSSLGERIRPVEVPINLVAFAGISLYLAVTGTGPAQPSLFLMLGVFSIWTETALLERHLGLMSRVLARKVRADDPLPFAGAILGVVGAAMLGQPTGALRGVAVPVAMAMGSFLATFVTGLDWRRSALSAILVVYNGTGGAILRTAMTLAVIGNIARGAGS